MAWLRRTCVMVMVGGTAAAAVAGVVAAAVTALRAAVITPCSAIRYFTTTARRVAVLRRFTVLAAKHHRSFVTWAIGPSVLSYPVAGGPIVKVMIAGLVAVRVAVLITAVVAVTYAQPPPDAAASTAAAPVTRHGRGRVAQEIKPAGEGEQHEVSERVQGLFRPAATGPIRAEDPASGSTGRPVRLHSLPSRAPGDVCRLHLSRLSQHLRKSRAATVRWGEPAARGRRVRDSTVRWCTPEGP